MKRINIEEFQQFRVACLNSLDEVIEICYNNNILKHNFDYTSKLNDTYKYHSTRHEGALTKIEGEIFDVYKMMTVGGIPTRVGEMEVFSMENNLDIQYAEGDNMIGMTNLKMKVNGRQLYTTTYLIECECGKKGFSSVKKAMLPKCHKCAGQAHVAPQMPMEEMLELCEVTRNEDGSFQLVGEGINIELSLDNAQKETINKIATDDAKELLRTLYVMDNKSIDSNKKSEAPRPASVPVARPVKKSTTSTKSRSKITDEDLSFVLQQIRTHFTEKSFKSRDLAPKVAERLTARQLPSRLTQLVNKGILNADNASPKNYTIKEG